MPTYNNKFQKAYNLKKDHAEIKKLIKIWELQVDEIMELYEDDPNEVILNSGLTMSETLNKMSQEMMAINI